ncbi:MAG: UbiA family prenyltransferase [Planctomycetota bacterium]
MLDYLRLCRLPNVFTAMADILMGYAFVQQGIAFPDWGTLPARLFLLIASAALYTAGMVLNDVYDLEIDRVERPQRPLPAGRIDWRWASKLGYLLLIGGVLAAGAAMFAGPHQAALPWRSGAVALLLAICIVAYDAGLKRTWFGPISMGSCRFFNVLLGMSLATHVDTTNLWRMGFEPAQLMVAAGVGTYIVGVTWFARTEAETSNRLPLILAIFVMAVGFLLIACYPKLGGEYGRVALPRAEMFWPALLSMLFLPIAKRCLAAVMNPTPQRVQAAIKNCIASLIILDASICLAAGSREWSLVTVALIVPMLLLGRWVYST